jgi:DNA-directed RNA polymerase specialized sigma24 family protein
LIAITPRRITAVKGTSQSEDLPQSARIGTPAESLEAALAAMQRTEEQTKERMRAHFLHGMSLPDIAARDGVRVEGVANAARRVRAKLALLASPVPDREPLSRSMGLVRVREEDLELALGAMPRTEEQTKDRMRAHFIHGKGLTEIAEQEGVRIEVVANAARRVREVLEEQASPWQYVGVSLTLPVILAKELQILSEQLGKLTRRSDADSALGPVLAAVMRARKRTAQTDK